MAGPAKLGRGSAGFIRPSLAVDGSELGLRWKPECRPIVRLLLVERDAAQQELDALPASTQEAVEWAGQLLDEQRARLAALGGAEWAAAIEGVAAVEGSLLARAFVGLPVERIAIPGSWNAATAVAATARRLGI